jgi:hypothetical protein
MRLNERHTLPVLPDEAWAALNDVAVLQQALLTAVDGLLASPGGPLTGASA